LGPRPRTQRKSHGPRNPSQTSTTFMAAPLESSDSGYDNRGIDYTFRLFFSADEPLSPATCSSLGSHELPRPPGTRLRPTSQLLRPRATGIEIPADAAVKIDPPASRYLEQPLYKHGEGLCRLGGQGLTPATTTFSVSLNKISIGLKPASASRPILSFAIIPSAPKPSRCDTFIAVV
jgi:hypothetical protein